MSSDYSPYASRALPANTASNDSPSRPTCTRQAWYSAIWNAYAAFSSSRSRVSSDTDVGATVVGRNIGQSAHEREVSV